MQRSQHLLRVMLRVRAQVTPDAEFADYLEVDEDFKTEYPHLLAQLNAQPEPVKAGA